MAAAPYQQTVGGTLAPLTAGPIPRSIRIKALAANATGMVYVGLAGVTTGTGYQLAAGDELQLFNTYVADAGSIYIIGSTSGMVVCVIVD